MPIVADPVDYIPDDILHIDLAKIRWRATGNYLDGADSRARLSVIVRIGGTDHHLEAIEVSVIDGFQCGADGVEDAFEEIATELQENEAFEGVSMKGRTYVLSMRPFTRPIA